VEEGLVEKGLVEEGLVEEGLEKGLVEEGLLKEGLVEEGLEEGLVEEEIDQEIDQEREAQKVHRKLQILQYIQYHNEQVRNRLMKSKKLLFATSHISVSPNQPFLYSHTLNRLFKPLKK